VARKPVLTTFNEVKSVFNSEQQKKLSEYLKGDHQRKIRYSKIIDALGLTWGIYSLQVYDDECMCRGYNRFTIYVFAMECIFRAIPFYKHRAIRSTYSADKAREHFQATLGEFNNLHSNLSKEDYFRFLQRLMYHARDAVAYAKDHAWIKKGKKANGDKRKSRVLEFTSQEYDYQKKLFKKAFF
jgi:hypothetical protein